MRTKGKGRHRKHRADQNHGKNGFVSGNARYRRSNPDAAHGMGRAKMSASWK